MPWRTRPAGMPAVPGATCPSGLSASAGETLIHTKRSTLGIITGGARISRWAANPKTPAGCTGKRWAEFQKPTYEERRGWGDVTPFGGAPRAVRRTEGSKS